MQPAATPFLKTLCGLRWVAIATQASTLLVVALALDMALPWSRLWGAVLLLAAFNLYAQWRCALAKPAPAAEAFAHLLVDIGVLTWIIGWTGGIANPFGSLFLLPIALTALALPLRWTLATAAACMAGYVLAAALGQPLPHVAGSDFDLHLWGMAANFVLSVAVVLFFSTRLVAARDRRERELAAMRERFARDEGILALATHAAAVAHELNTPLATLTLLVDELDAQPLPPGAGEDLAGMRELLEVCRQRVRELASPADPETASDIDLERVLTQWQLVRPRIELHRAGTAARGLAIDRGVGHLLLALLNNAADASEANGGHRVDLRIESDARRLRGEIRDYGRGFSGHALLPALFRSDKPDGLGMGLALSHATVERLGGTLSIASAADGARVSFEVPLPDTKAPSGGQP
ncbi:ATP-binding protein [Luteimonas sp. R10]|uniref:ATP-binding protein n=1 Tax=Luteimonas sp. R10 TaxID=3108176 RepID=UPI00308A0C66|nr:ATP-binding protein [Luteimonas sp. R10]